MAAKQRAIELGITHFDTADMYKLVGKAISAIQSEYFLWTRVAENEVLPLCKKLGIGFVAYSPLA